MKTVKLQGLCVCVGKSLKSISGSVDENLDKFREALILKLENFIIISINYFYFISLIFYYYLNVSFNHIIKNFTSIVITKVWYHSFVYWYHSQNIGTILMLEVII
jgi:hypothetical protein